MTTRSTTKIGKAKTARTTEIGNLYTTTIRGTSISGITIKARITEIGTLLLVEALI